MFQNPTMFILGAGASVDAGLPLGADLIETIRNDTAFHIQQGSRLPVGGNENIHEVIRQHAGSQERLGSGVGDYFAAARVISAAAEGTRSIDDLLYKIDDEIVTFVGKVAIANAILSKEMGEKFSAPAGRGNEFSILQFKNTWYLEFGKMLIDGDVRKANAADAVKNLTIINFNYDRTVEHFLARFFEQALNLTRTKAEEIVEMIPIYHPYGTVGALPWQRKKLENRSPSISLGDGSWQAVYKAAGQIKTYTERVEDGSMLDDIRAAMARTSKLVFLGFGFHTQNMALLEPDEKNVRSIAYATTFSESESNRDLMRLRLGRIMMPRDLVSRDDRAKSIYRFREDRDCCELLNEYRLEIGE